MGTVEVATSTRQVRKANFFFFLPLFFAVVVT